MLTKEQVNKIKIEWPGGLDRIPIILDALGDLKRFRIFKLLTRHHELCVTDIARILDITVSAASQQLRVLERLNLAKRTKMGQIVCYELNKNNLFVKPLLQFLKSAEKINPKYHNL
jgi:DNA-binding transcriptional ArsR family regulator